MTRFEEDIPAGYVGVLRGRVKLVARPDTLDDFGIMLGPPNGARGGAGSLYDFAARAPDRRRLAGRGPAFAIALPRSGLRVVVRHNRRGGLAAALTGDRFFPPTRAPVELAISRRLAAAGVATPEIVGYAVYPAGIFRRADVVSAEIAPARDLSTILTAGTEPERNAAWLATARLLSALTAAGVRHYDLNVKNVLLREVGDSAEATVLDVDRVRFGEPGDSRITEWNFERLARSARKWRKLHAANASEEELSYLRSLL